MKAQSTTQGSCFTFKLPALFQDKDEVIIVDTKVRFAIRREDLLDSFKQEVVIRVPPFIIRSPLQNSIDLLMRTLFSQFSEEEFQKPTPAMVAEWELIESTFFYFFYTFREQMTNRPHLQKFSLASYLASILSASMMPIREIKQSQGA